MTLHRKSLAAILRDLTHAITGLLAASLVAELVDAVLAVDDEVPDVVQDAAAERDARAWAMVLGGWEAS